LTKTIKKVIISRHFVKVKLPRIHGKELGFSLKDQKKSLKSVLLQPQQA